MGEQLSDAGKEELAIALVLWKDFKAQGKFDPDVALQMFSLADHLGIRKETEKMLAKLPPVKIIPRYP